MNTAGSIIAKLLVATLDGIVVVRPQAISIDACGYVLERYRIESWRAVLVDVNRTLKTNQAFESAKINGSWSWRWTPTNSSTAGDGVAQIAASISRLLKKPCF